jgi:tetratricopeptide (TPR) repeat protein
MRLPLVLGLLLGWAVALAGQPGAISDPAAELERLDELLAAWQLSQARRLAEELYAEHPAEPAVQLGAAWVKFHQGEHAVALELAERAAAGLPQEAGRDPRLELIRATARVTRGFRLARSADGRVEVAFQPGVDEVLVPDVMQAVERTLEVVGRDLGHTPDHPIRVELLPSSEALSALTGLALESIRQSGTIAVCKWNRLMLTSPRAALMGYGYLDTASHELVHLLVSQRTWNRTPIWLHEALAKHEESRWREGEPLYRPGLSPREESRLARAVRTGALITFDEMHPSMALLPSAQAAELAFSEVYTVTRFLLARGGYEKLGSLLERLKDGQEDMRAIEAVYGLGRAEFVRAWLDWLMAARLRELEGDEALEPGGRGRRAETDGERRLLGERALGARDHFHLGQLLRARGRTAPAAVMYQQAREKAGARHAGLWVIADKLGLALMELGRAAEAREAFLQSLELHPEGLEAHLHLGRLVAEEDPERAFLHGREAVRQNPLDPRVHRLLQAAAGSLADRSEGAERASWAAAAERHALALRLLAYARTGPGPEVAPAPPPSEGGGQTVDRSASARLRVLSRPWARVWVDFVDTGLTTPVLELEVRPGRRWVVLEADCPGGRAAAWVEARQGEVVVVERDLCPTPAAAAR